MDTIVVEDIKSFAFGDDELTFFLIGGRWAASPYDAVRLMGSYETYAGKLLVELQDELGPCLIRTDGAAVPQGTPLLLLSDYGLYLFSFHVRPKNGRAFRRWLLEALWNLDRGAAEGRTETNETNNAADARLIVAQAIADCLVDLSAPVQQFIIRLVLSGDVSPQATE